MIVLRQNTLDLGLRVVNLVVEVLGRDALGAVAEDDQLLEIIACCHADTAAAAEFKTQPLNILIRCLCLPGVDNMDVVVFFHRTKSLRHLVRVKTRMSVQPR